MKFLNCLQKVIALLCCICMIGCTNKNDDPVVILKNSFNKLNTYTDFEVDTTITGVQLNQFWDLELGEQRPRNLVGHKTVLKRNSKTYEMMIYRENNNEHLSYIRSNKNMVTYVDAILNSNNQYEIIELDTYENNSDKYFSLGPLVNEDKDCYKFTLEEKENEIIIYAKLIDRDKLIEHIKQRILKDNPDKNFYETYNGLTLTKYEYLKNDHEFHMNKDYQITSYSVSTYIDYGDGRKDDMVESFIIHESDQNDLDINKIDKISNDIVQGNLNEGDIIGV